MKKIALLLVIVALPTLAWSQEVRVTSVHPPAEIRAAAGPGFIQVDSGLATLAVGDEVRTGSGGSMTLELPDGSYVVVSENTTLTIENFWGSDVKNIMRLMLGKVRFFIQRWGGRPNPYRVDTPTALIAVRGTTFEVSVDAGAVTEVYCFDGRVSVETVGRSDREVVLDAGRKTQVRFGQYPLAPVAIEEGFGASRVVEVVRKNDETGIGAQPVPGVDGAVVDNDRRNLERLSRPEANQPGSWPEIRRGKLSFPQ